MVVGWVNGFNIKIISVPACMSGPIDTFSVALRECHVLCA